MRKPITQTDCATNCAQCRHVKNDVCRLYNIFIPDNNDGPYYCEGFKTKYKEMKQWKSSSQY